MGPEATASLYLGIINRCQRELGAKYNSDFPPIIINSCPVPDGRMWKGFNKSEVEKFIRANIRILENAGADFVVSPCNSVHHFMPIMRKAVHIPVLSIVEETAREIQKRKLTKVLLLATEFTVKSGIYDKPLARRGVKLVAPTSAQQRLIERIIISTESGQRAKSDKAAIVRIVNTLRKDAGIEGVIEGCTEIPLLLKQNDIPIPLLDTIDILAESAYAGICGRRLMP